MKKLRFIALLTAFLLCAAPVTEFQSADTRLFSSVSVHAEDAAASVWDGTYDTSWYDSEETEFHLSKAEQLAGFIQLVNDGHQTKNLTIYLDGDMNFNNRPVRKP